MKTDEWDWPYILYIGRTILGYRDAEVWSMTPRYFKAQIDVHMYIKKIENGESAERDTSMGYIDQLNGW